MSCKRSQKKPICHKLSPALYFYRAVWLLLACCFGLTAVWHDFPLQQEPFFSKKVHLKSKTKYTLYDHILEMQTKCLLKCLVTVHYFFSQTFIFAFLKGRCCCFAAFLLLASLALFELVESAGSTSCLRTIGVWLVHHPTWLTPKTHHLRAILQPATGGALLLSIFENSLCFLLPDNKEASS